MTSIRSTLSRAFFRPGDLLDLAIVRVVLAAAYLIELGPGLQHQIRLAEESPEATFVPLPALKVLLLPLGWGSRPDPDLLVGVWWASHIAAALVLVGLFTRPAALVWAATYTLMVAHMHSYGELHHPEAPYAIAIWILAFSASGAALSLDRVRRRLRTVSRRHRFTSTTPAERVSPEATWPLQAMLWVLAICYLSAGAFKLVNAGLTWLNGHTLAFYLIQDGLRWDRPMALEIGAMHGVMVAMSVLTLAFELTVWVAVLVPVAALVYVPVGLGLHAGIWWLMRAMFPHWVVLYIAFLPGLREGWRQLGRHREWSYRRSASGELPPSARGDRARDSMAAGAAELRSARSRIVVFDGGCLLCLRTMACLDELDTGGRLGFVDGRGGPEYLPEAVRGRGIDVMHAMCVVERDGAVRSGFHAFRSIARVLPTLWPIVPLLYAPGARVAGPRIYAAVARRRSTCDTGGCAIRSEVSAPVPD